MNEEMMNRSYEVQVERESLGRYTAKTFGWMFAGLLITFAVAVGGLFTGAIAYVYSIPYWYYILFAAEIAWSCSFQPGLRRCPWDWQGPCFSCMPY